MKKDTGENFHEKNWDLDKLYSFLYILKIISNTDNFHSWLREYHHLDIDENLFHGYQFFVDVVISNILDAIDINQSFGLEEDYTIFRAAFRGVILEDIPTSCEKTKLLKNLWFHYKILRKCNDFNEYSEILKEKNKPIFTVFDSIFKEYIYTHESVPTEQIVNKETILNAHVYLSDTRRGGPNAYPIPLIASFITDDNFHRVFFGYLYTLQYLWYGLIGKEEFANSSICQMHKAIELFNLDTDDEDFLPDNNPIEREVYLNWQALDRFFSKINQEIIENKDLPRYAELQLKNDFSKISLKPLMKLIKIQEPRYFTRHSNNVELEKRLDSFFYWHDIDVLDTNKIHVFNGASAFISVLIGEVKKYEIFKINDTIVVARIKHPVSHGKNDRSYAILLRSGGFITDTSGWLIFLDCGTDYSGSGIYLTEQIESFLDRFKKEKKIEIQEISISSDDFLHYLKKKRLPSKIRDIQKQTDEIIRLAGIESDQFPLYQEIKNLEGQNTDRISEQIGKILFFFHVIIPNKTEYSLLLKKLELISSLDRISDKLEIISMILPFIPHIVISENLSSIKSKLNEIELKISPSISGKYIITSGVEWMGTGCKYELEIPVGSAGYPELIRGMNDLARKGSIKIKDIPKKVKELMIPKF